MAVSTGSFTKAIHGDIRNLGNKAILSDATLVIKGFEHVQFLCNSFPWPIITTQQAIDVPGPLGTKMVQPGQAKTSYSGPITFQETVAGTCDQFLLDLISQGGVFDAKIYEGTPRAYLRYKVIEQAHIYMEKPPQRDWGSATLLIFSGVLNYHYYGETVDGAATYG
jgi:hypothetical protein